MAKKRKKRAIKKTPQRDITKPNYHIKKKSLLRETVKNRNKITIGHLKKIEDLRIFDFKPAGYHDPLTLAGIPAVIKLSAPKKPTKQKDRTKDRLQFQNPLKTIVCIKRRIRRETLFKLRKIGKGTGSFKRRIMSPTSYIKC